MIDGIRPRRPSKFVFPANTKPPANVRPAHIETKDIANNPTSDFTPPEEVEQGEMDMPTPLDMTDETPMKSPKKPRRSFKEWLKSRSKKQWIIFSVIVVLLLGGGGYAAYKLAFHQKPPVKPVLKVNKAKLPPKPTTEPSKLTGLQVDPSVNLRPVIAVMNENSLDARPQSGIDKAGVVFEAVAEGGITRFIDFFQDTDPGYIGPVRSVRPYYIQWALGFDAAIAHAGGSTEALGDMKAWNVKDLNDSSAYFYRIGSRAAPHNLYTDITKLRAYAAAKGYGTANFTGFARKADKPSKTPTAKSISFNISSDDFNPHYDYDATTNSYKRSEGGAPHMAVDAAGTATQITPKVVIAMIMAQGKEGVYSTYGVIGTGHVFIFQDGTVTEGSWTKTDRTTNITFTDANGKTIGLNAGQTWLIALGSSDKVSYTP